MFGYDLELIWLAQEIYYVYQVPSLNQVVYFVGRAVNPYLIYLFLFLF